MFQHLMLVALGGAIGSAARFLCGAGVSRIAVLASFPWSTLAVNVTGCFIIGFAGGLGASKQIFTEAGRLFLFTGILGGFTTFSAFGLETFYLLRQGQMLLALGNVALQLVLGLGAVAIGYRLAEFL